MSEGDRPPSDPAKAASNVVEQKLAEIIVSKLPPGPIEPKQFAEFIVSALTVEVRQISEFSGPLPPPRMLAEYEKVKPGFADQIVKRSDKEQDFRHEMGRSQVKFENRSLTHRAGLGYTAQLGALLLGMTALIGGIILGMNGQSAAGIAAIVTALATLTAAFITGQIVQGKKQENGAGGRDESTQENSD
ncbi:MAG: DUF2335 domain-containing protein [Planctomycetia bacterium]|nr:DUF2335 domain-containing protein [Planctomycetia bacterium]